MPLFFLAAALSADTPRPRLTLPPPILIKPGATASPGPILESALQEFQWKGVRGATASRVSIRDLTTDVLFVSDVSAPSTRLKKELIPGHQYRWNMRALTGHQGGEHSPTFYFQIALTFAEALTNLVRHASATRAEVTLTVAGRELRVAIADNSAGSSGENRSQFGSGLNHMRCRIGALGGRLDFKSEPGQGTRVTFSATIPEET